MARVIALQPPTWLSNLSLGAAVGTVTAAVGQIVGDVILPDDRVNAGPLLAAGALGGALIALPIGFDSDAGSGSSRPLPYFRSLICTASTGTTGAVVGASLAELVGRPLVNPLSALVVGCMGSSAIAAFAIGATGASFVVDWATR